LDAVPGKAGLVAAYPALHVQLKDSGVLMQVELPTQLSCFSWHSSLSGHVAYAQPIPGEVDVVDVVVVVLAAVTVLCDENEDVVVEVAVVVDVEVGMVVRVVVDVEFLVVVVVVVVRGMVHCASRPF
jgi:hypothetical protein